MYNYLVTVVEAWKCTISLYLKWYVLFAYRYTTVAYIHEKPYKHTSIYIHQEHSTNAKNIHFKYTCTIPLYIYKKKDIIISGKWRKNTRLCVFVVFITKSLIILVSTIFWLERILDLLKTILFIFFFTYLSNGLNRTIHYKTQNNTIWAPNRINCDW